MKYLLIFIALLALQPAFSQTETPDCGFYGTKTVAERKALFPFNVAKKVILVGYLSGQDRSRISDTLRILPQVIKSEVLTTGKTRKVYNIVEEHEIVGGALDSLSNIMFNYGLKPGQTTRRNFRADCYDPRNSVLFYDEKSKLIGNLEICFECGRAYFEPDEKVMKDLYYTCPEVMYVLNDFFKQEGIKHGIRHDE
jgi:hypothetical protein